jgi:UDP-N-acetylmuramoylalanine--D-glutamate ligase
MIIVPTFAGKMVAVLGLGKSGLSAAIALKAGGANVRAWDDGEEARRSAMSIGIAIADLNDLNWDDCAALVLSPGIPLNFPTPHPIVQLARSHDCQIIGDIDLLCRSQGDARFIGITGTNGKSTTTTLMGHILGECGMATEAGGNLGTPALDLAPLDEQGTYVLELSSYQLDLCPAVIMDVAVLLNITPDHLDRHGGMDGYIAAKRQIFKNQSSDHTAVVGIDDEFTTKIFEDLSAKGQQRLIPVSGTRVVPGGVYAVDGMLIDDLEGNSVSVLDMRDALALPGEHNHQNAAAAYAVARLIGLASDAIVQAVISYPGLIHRQERLDHHGDVLFINDSKATNPAAAAKALASYDDIYWIAGGQAKGGGFDVLTPHLGHVRHAYLVGEAAGELEQAFGGRVPCHISGDIQNATQDAHDQAAHDQIPGSVVLFSPACASFDQFQNFEVRGDFFKNCVSALDHGGAA